jgi:hypothetical protein
MENRIVLSNQGEESKSAILARNEKLPGSVVSCILSSYNLIKERGKLFLARKYNVA